MTAAVYSYDDFTNNLSYESFSEKKAIKYKDYLITDRQGKCGNSSIRQEKLDELFAEVVGRVRVNSSVVEDIRRALLEDQRDRTAYQTQSVEALTKREKRLQKLVDSAYEDKLSGVISSDMWERKSKEWQSELLEIGHKIRSFEGANVDYYKKGVEILELANKSYSLYLTQELAEKRLVLQKLLWNLTITHRTLYPTYKKPFDILAKGSDFELWRGLRDEFRNWVLTSAA